MPMKRPGMKILVIKSKKVEVTFNKRTNRVSGVHFRGKFYIPISHFNAKGRKLINGAVRIAGLKRIYYTMDKKRRR